MDDRVSALTVRGSEVYGGGWFTNAGGVNASHIAKWDGTLWSELGAGMNGNVYALAVSGDDLYAGGSFTVAGTANATNIAKWDGYTWSALGLGMNNSVNALAASGTNLYAGGNFTAAGGVPANYVAKWNGSDWSALDLGMNGAVRALSVIGNNLYANGDFTTAGGVAANRIAKWDGNTWSALGSGTDKPGYALAVDGAGHLFVGGSFLVAGTNVSPFIAQANIGAALGRFSNLFYSPSTGFNCTFLDGSVGQPYRIQTSPSPVVGPWTDLTNFIYASPIVITDTSAISATNTFYRAVTP